MGNRYPDGFGRFEHQGPDLEPLYISRTGIKMHPGAYASSRQDTDYTGSGVGTSSWGRSVSRGPAVQTSMCIEAGLSRRLMC
jgi:hypothetical protein